MSMLSYFLRTTYWLKDYLNGSPIQKHYKDIQFIMEDYEYGEKRRAELLKELLKHAGSNSKFYSHYDSKVFHSFPVVNKSILLKAYEEIKIPSDKIPGQDGDIFIQKTSGSTGMPFAIPHSTLKRNRRIAELKYFGLKSGFKSHERLVQLRTWNRWQPKSKRQAHRENIIPFDISRLNDSKLKELCSIINEKKAVAIRGYASSLDLLTRYAKSHNIRFKNLKLMISGSEALQESTRDIVQNYLGCRIISQYANEENGILAQERHQKEGASRFYLNHASYIFEILKMNEDEPADFGEPGRIVITDLYSYAFPMIRYDTGDTGVLLPEDRYSNQYPVIEKLFGRRVDLVTDSEGGIVHPISFSRILKNYSGILQWQFIQKGEKEYLLKLITNHSDLNIEEIKDEFMYLFGQKAHIGITFVDEIPVLASGKRKPVINNWKK